MCTCRAYARMCTCICTACAHLHLRKKKVKFFSSKSLLLFFVFIYGQFHTKSPAPLFWPNFALGFFSLSCPFFPSHARKKKSVLEQSEEKSKKHEAKASILSNFRNLLVNIKIASKTTRVSFKDLCQRLCYYH